jgi:hypothetical protein
MMPRLPRTFGALALTIAFGTLVACGGGNGKVPAKASSDASSISSESAAQSESESDAKAKADPSDPCSLLSQSEAEKAIGSKLKSAPKDEDDPRVPGTKGCTYATADPTRSFAIDVFESTDSGEAFVESAQSDGTTLEGVGDKAAYDDQFHRMYVKAGDVAFAVVFVIGDLDDEQDAGTKIATAVVNNL